MEEVLDRDEMEKEEKGTVEQTGWRALITTWFSRMFGNDTENDSIETIKDEDPKVLKELQKPLEAEEIEIGEPDKEPEGPKKEEASSFRARQRVDTSNNSGGGGNSNRAGNAEMQQSLSDGQEQQIDKD